MTLSPDAPGSSDVHVSILTLCEAPPPLVTVNFWSVMKQVITEKIAVKNALQRNGFMIHRNSNMSNFLNQN